MTSKVHCPHLYHECLLCSVPLYWISSVDTAMTRFEPCAEESGVENAFHIQNLLILQPLESPHFFPSQGCSDPKLILLMFVRTRFPTKVCCLKPSGRRFPSKTCPLKSSRKNTTTTTLSFDVLTGAFPSKSYPLKSVRGFRLYFIFCILREKDYYRILSSEVINYYVLFHVLIF